MLNKSATVLLSFSPIEFFSLSACSNYGAAAPKFEQALRLKNSIGEKDSKTVADLFNMLGNALEMRGDFDHAEPALRKAMDLKKRIYGELSAEYADPLSDLGLLLWYRGDLLGAENLTRPSVEVKRKLSGGKKDLAASIGNLGTILWEQGRFREAEQNLNEALEISRTFQLQPGDIGLASMNLALVQRDQGNLPDAERLFREAIGLLPEAHPYAVRCHLYLAGVLRRRAALSSDQALLYDALRLNPSDPFTADALAAVYARSSLTQLCSSEKTTWRFTSSPPPSSWTGINFQNADWLSCSSISGIATYAPYSPRIDRSIRFHTNVWLRREFDLPSVPTGKIVLGLNPCHDAEVFINGVQTMPVADWTDSAVLQPCSACGQAALTRGKNLMAVHCREIDGGTTVGVGIFSTTDSSLGRLKLLEKYNELLQAESQRAELYVGRANAYARLSQWNDAARDLNHALALAPDSVAHWFQLATVLVQLGDSASYARHRREGLRQFTQPANPTIAAQIVLGALLSPIPATESESIMKLADFAATATYGDKGLVLRQLAKGLADFRLGRFANAPDWLARAEASAKHPELIGWNHERQRNRSAAACLLQAMAQHRSFHSQEAQKLLARGKQIVQTELPENNCGDIGREWPDWIIAQIFLHQAEDLIEGHQTKEASK